MDLVKGRVLSALSFFVNKKGAKLPIETDKRSIRTIVLRQYRKVLDRSMKDFFQASLIYH